MKPEGTCVSVKTDINSLRNHILSSTLCDLLWYAALITIQTAINRSYTQTAKELHAKKRYQVRLIPTTVTTRHRTSTSTYSLTVLVRVMLP